MPVCASKFIFSDSDDFGGGKLTLKAKFWYFLIPPHYTNLQNLMIFDYSWFLAKNLSNFVSFPWKLHNRYCHNWWLTINHSIDLYSSVCHCPCKQTYPKPSFGWWSRGLSHISKCMNGCFTGKLNKLFFKCHIEHLQHWKSNSCSCLGTYLQFIW